MSCATPLFGLVLAGGASKRMGRDKAALVYHDKPQLTWTFELLQLVCERVFVAVRPEQTNDPLRAALPHIPDRLEDKGPIAGIHAAQALHPEAAWLVTACDLPFLNRAALDRLLAHRDPSRAATAYRSSDGLPQPLCAVYEPRSRMPLSSYIESGGASPREFLLRSDVCLLDPPDPRALNNLNTPPEALAANDSLRRTGERTIHVQYYAILREQAGRSEERVVTAAATPEALYDELKRRYPFHLPRSQLKVAVNSKFSDWSAPLQDEDSVVFIPPVAGG